MTHDVLRIKALSAATDTAPPTLRDYAAAGLIPAARDSNGNWIFPQEAIDAVRRLRAARQPRQRDTRVR